MLAAQQRVTEEVLGTCRHEALLALRRSVLPCTPIQSKRKSELIIEIALECDALAKRQRIFTEVLGIWLVQDLRSFIARLKGLGYMVSVAPRPRQHDLIATIVNAGECLAKATIVSKQTSKTRMDICSSASAAAATAPTVSKRAPAEQSPSPDTKRRWWQGSRGETRTMVMGEEIKAMCKGACSIARASEGPWPAVEPPS